MPSELSASETIRVPTKKSGETTSRSAQKRARSGAALSEADWEVRAQSYQETLKEIWKYTEGIDPAVIEAEVDAALAEVRAEKRAHMGLIRTGS